MLYCPIVLCWSGFVHTYLSCRIVFIWFYSWPLVVFCCAPVMCSLLKSSPITESQSMIPKANQWINESLLLLRVYLLLVILRVHSWRYLGCYFHTRFTIHKYSRQISISLCKCSARTVLVVKTSVPIMALSAQQRWIYAIAFTTCIRYHHIGL